MITETLLRQVDVLKSLTLAEQQGIYLTIATSQSHDKLACTSTVLQVSLCEVSLSTPVVSHLLQFKITEQSVCLAISFYIIIVMFEVSRT